MGRGVTMALPLAAVVLGAVLILAMGLWLDRRAATRDADAALFSLVGEVMTAVATTRGALAVANAADENAERLHAISLARQQMRLLTGAYAVATVRLTRDLSRRGAPVDAVQATDLIPEILIPAMDVLQRCAQLGRDRLRRPDGSCLAPEVLAASLARCERAILLALDETIARPEATESQTMQARQVCVALPALPITSGGSL